MDVYNMINVSERMRSIVRKDRVLDKIRWEGGKLLIAQVSPFLYVLD